MDNRGSISGRHCPSVEVLLLRFNSYANAQSWEDLVYVFTEALRNSSLDEIVLLLHDAVLDSHGWRSKYVRPVFYNRLDEVPGLLLSMGPSALRTVATPAHPQRPRVEVPPEVQSDDDHDEQAQEKSIDIPQEKIADGAEEEAVISDGDHEDETDRTRIVAARTIQDAYRHHLERKRAGAVRKIQAACRRYLKRKAVVRKGMEATQAHYWHLLRKRSMKMKWAKGSRYYLLLRVPLAYILVCLDTIKAFSESEKKEAKKRVMTEDDKNLEELMESLKQHRYDHINRTLYQTPNKPSSKLLNKTIALQKKLSPSSKFHEGRSVRELQGAVLEVKAIVESLESIPNSIETRNKIKRRWDRGWKWILEEQGSGRKGKKAEKPKLVLDREDLMYL